MTTISIYSCTNIDTENKISSTQRFANNIDIGTIHTYRQIVKIITHNNTSITNIFRNTYLLTRTTNSKSKRLYLLEIDELQRQQKAQNTEQKHDTVK